MHRNAKVSLGHSKVYFVTLGNANCKDTVEIDLNSLLSSQQFMG